MTSRNELIMTIRDQLVQQFESRLYEYTILNRIEKDIIAVNVIKAIDHAFNAVCVGRELVEMD